MDKKIWQKPTLIALVRNTPEEAVLGACKQAGGDGPATQIQGCDWSDYPFGGCISPPSCSVVAVS